MPFSAAIASVEHSLASIRDVPLAVHLPVAVVLITGCLMCLWGAKLLKPLYALLFAACGGAIGALLLPNFLPETLGGLSSPIIGLGVGILLGTILAALTYRVALAVTSAAALGLAGCAVSLVCLLNTPGAIPSLQPAAEKALDTVERHAHAARDEISKQQLGDQLARAKDRLTGAAPAATAKTAPSKSTEVGPPTASPAQRVRDFLDEIFANIHETWDSLPSDSKTTLVAATLGSAMLGFVCGLVAPKKAAAAVTSLAGGALALASAAWFLKTADALPDNSLTHRPLFITAIWLGIALAGFIAQLPRKARPAPPAQEAPAAQ